MQAVVLVGGFGTRLRPLTDTVPKPVLPVGHIPMIVRLVGHLARGGVDRVTLALGFKSEHFHHVFPGQRCGDVEIVYAVEPSPLDTGGAIRFAADVAGIDDTFVVANGDVLTGLDLTSLVSFHRRTGAEATLHLTPVADPSVFGVVETEDDGRVRRFIEKPAKGTATTNLVNAGTYVFQPEAVHRIPAGERVSVERVTFPAIVDDERLYAMPTNDYWIDIGRPDAYLQANLDLLAASSDDHVASVDDGATLGDGVTIVHSLVTAGAKVGARSRLSGSVLLAGAVVGADVRLDSCVVMGTVGDGATLTRSIVGATGSVPSGAVLTDARVPEPGV